MRNLTWKSGLIAFWGILVGIHSVACAQTGESAVQWKKDCAAAVAQAKQGSKAVLVFFKDSASVSSIRMWKYLGDKAVTADLESRFIPVLVDMDTEKQLAGQLGVSEPGVVVVYNSQGRALTMLKEKDVKTADALGKKLQALALQHGFGSTPTATASVTGSEAAPPPSANASAVPSARPDKPAAKKGEASSAEFPNAIPADQVKRDAHLGREVAVTGRIVIFEASTAKNRPNIMTLTTRAEDPVQIVYWEQAAEGVHKGRPIPKEGDLVSVRGKLTDYRGRLQFKVDQPEQMRYLPQ